MNMNMNMKQKKHLAIAISIASTIGLGVTTAQAVDFSASATVENTLTVAVVNDFDLGTLFATANGSGADIGVGALVIAPDGTVTDPTDSATVTLINLGTPVPAQGSISMTAGFTMTLPNTAAYTATEFADATGNAAALTTDLGVTIPLVHSTGDPSVPSLYLAHFTVGDVSGGVSTEGTTNEGDFTIVPSFGATTYVFNIGGTVTTKPYNGADASEAYQTGVYSGTFAVTASY